MAARIDVNPEERLFEKKGEEIWENDTERDVSLIAEREEEAATRAKMVGSRGGKGEKREGKGNRSAAGVAF